MVCHPLATQLRFARSKFQRCLDGVSAQDAMQGFKPMNCVSWIVGHLANQENTYWVLVAQGRQIAPGLRELVGFGELASMPPLGKMWAVWRTVTAAADEFVDTLTAERLQVYFERRGRVVDESVGTLLMRNIYQYW